MFAYFGNLFVIIYVTEFLALKLSNLIIEYIPGIKIEFRYKEKYTNVKVALFLKAKI